MSWADNGGGKVSYLVHKREKWNGPTSVRHEVKAELEGKILSRLHLDGQPPGGDGSWEHECLRVVSNTT